VISQQTRRALEERYFPGMQDVIFCPFAKELDARLNASAALGEPVRILDLGSGAGTWVLVGGGGNAMASVDRTVAGISALVIGVDAAIPKVDGVAPWGMGAFLQGQADELPLATDSVNMVLAYNVVEHLQRPGDVLAEVARVLRPGGWLCLKTPAANTPLFALSRALPTCWHRRLKATLDTPKEDVFPTYYCANTTRALDLALGEAGFAREWLRKVDQTYAYVAHASWTYALGLVYSRLVSRNALGWLANQIVGVYRWRGVRR